MLVRLAAAFAAGVAAVFSAAGSTGRWCFQMARGIIRFPFDLLGGGQPMPAPFEPEVQQADILDAFLEARKRAADVHRLDRDGVDSVMEFCSTHRDDRPAFALPKSLKSDVKVALRTMDDAALMSLKRAGIGKVKKFIDSQPHDIPGVPVVGQSKPKPTPLKHPPAGLTEHERLMWLVKARLDRARDFEPFAVCKP